MRVERHCDVVDEGLGGQAGRAAQVARALARHHRLVDDLSHRGCEREQLLVAAVQPGCVVHRAYECLDHAQGVEGRLLAALVRLPHVRHRAVRRLELLDHRPIGGLADQVGGDEARRAVHLCDLIGEHVTVVVVRGHAEATIRPADDLHRRRVRDQVRQLIANLGEETGLLELLEVMLIEDLLHRGPESLLPLEDGLLGHDVRRHLRLQAAREEDVRQVGHIVQRVVVYHGDARLVGQVALVDLQRRAAVGGAEHGRELAGADGLPARAVLATHRVTLEEHRPLEAKLHALDVDGIARDGDAVPAFPHRAVG